MPYQFKPYFDMLTITTKGDTHCHVPARCGLQQTTLAPGSDKTRARDPSYKLPKIEKDGPTTGPVLLRQGEPGTSQYIQITLEIHVLVVFY